MLIKGADLSDTKTADDDLKGLASLTDLNSLDLRATKISDDGLEHLLALENLTQLDVRETAVTADGVKRLRLSRPNLDIVVLGQLQLTRPQGAASRGQQQD